MTAREEVKVLWDLLIDHIDLLTTEVFRTEGVIGTRRPQHKPFALKGIDSKGLRLTIQGRKASSRKPASPIFKQEDLERCIAFKRGLIDKDEAKRSWKTSYSYPIYCRLLELQSNA